MRGKLPASRGITHHRATVTFSVLFEMNPSHPRDRAHTVCIQCHERKVKCDLEESRDNTCSNCHRFGHSCTRRTGARKRLKRTRPESGPSNFGPVETTKDGNVSFSHTTSPQISTKQCVHELNGDQEPHQPQSGFIADHSVLAFDTPSPVTLSEGSVTHSIRVREAILSATEAAVLPVPPLRRALTDAYFEHVFQNYPIVTSEDLMGSNASIVLQQSVCLAGSLMRHGIENMQLAHSLYEKIKTLIYLNHEPSDSAALKAMCLLSCWSVKPPDKISMDGPWYWTGVASRLAIQMGLHRESTYANRPASRGLRAVFWQLYNSDKLQVACWGRLPALSCRYIDVRPPMLEDFKAPNVQAKVFIHATTLCKIIGDIAELHLERRPVSPHEASRLTHALCSWVRELPDDLQLYSTDDRRKAFCRAFSEIFIKYFGAIILLQLLQSEINRQGYTSLRSLIAASCMSRLYEEIHYREQACCLLPINGFFCMVAALPQIYYQPWSTEKKVIRKQEIDILCSIMTSMKPKYGGSEMVLAKIRRLEKEVQASAERYLQETDAVGLPGNGILEGPSEGLEELFPFPSSICSHMDLIKQTGGLAQNQLSRDFVPMDDEWGSWLVSEGHSFVDLFGIYDHPSITPGE